MTSSFKMWIKEIDLVEHFGLHPQSFSKEFTVPSKSKSFTMRTEQQTKGFSTTSEAEGEVGILLNRSKPQQYLILLTIPWRYFRFGSLCLLDLVLVSVVTHSVCLDEI